MASLMSTRPNIRIEIHNNLVTPMDVDEEEKIESDEEGEISDANAVEESDAAPAAKLPAESATCPKDAWLHADGEFPMGVSIFGKQEREKLVERAKRFGLKADEINNFTDKHLQDIHESLGISTEDEKDVRFDAIHVRGTDEMSTEDVFEYFGKYGPSHVEWINDESCNVVWEDKVTAARALHFVSQPVKGMPVDGPRDPFYKELETEESKNFESEKEAGRSILLKNREVELSHDDKEENGENSDNSVHISDINVPVPPGYWRLGLPHPKSGAVLLRFALKTDKKPYRAERFSEYYKKYGNPNFGGMRGIITESRKKKIKGIFDRNHEISNNVEVDIPSKNPWGTLAKNWDEDAYFRENPVSATDSPPYRKVSDYSAEKSELMNRLGFKRAHDPSNETVDNEDVLKKNKVPRMRMYADDEEEKVKRKRDLLQVKLNHQIKRECPETPDLRSILETSTKRNLQPAAIEEEEVDLGTKLKNRKEKLYKQLEAEKRKENARKEPEPSSRIHEEVKGREIKSRTLRMDDVKLQPKKHDASSSRRDRRDERKRESSPRRKRDRKDTHHRTRYEGTLHSDRYEHRRGRSHFSHAEVQKPKSKVAVVIRTQRRPAVASTVWSRINSSKGRLKTASERLQNYRDSSSSTESSESDSSSSSSSESSSDSSEQESEIDTKSVSRPGFKGDVKSRLGAMNTEHKSPLRIEINNDQFKKK